MNYILNTNSGKLHTKACADGEVGFEPVKAGARKHYASADSARRDSLYNGDHSSIKCMGGE